MRISIQPIIAGSLTALFLAAIALRALATAEGVPIPTTDAEVFLPQAVSFYQTRELINPVWPGAAKLDRSGKDRMIYHGFLFPMTLAALMWRGDYLALVGALAVVHAAATLLPGLMYFALARRWHWKITGRTVLWILLATAACANYTQGVPTRPEPLAGILCAVAVGLMTLSPARWHGLAAGLAAGLMAAADPLPGALALLFFTSYAAWRFPLLRCAGEIVVASTAAMVSFGACFLVYPYSFLEWLAGSWRMGRYALEYGGAARFWPDFVRDYLLRGSTWFFGGVLLLALWTGVQALRQQNLSGAGPKAPVVFFATLIAGIAVLTRCVLYASWARYALLPFMPLALIPVLYQLGRGPSASVSRSYRMVAVIVLVTAMLGLVGDLLERAETLAHGVTLSAAREAFRRMRHEHGGMSIGLSRDLFTLTEDYAGIIFAKEVPPATADLWVVAQAHSGRGRPSPLAGFTLIENHFNSRPPSLLGLRWRNDDRGCGFAVYQRNPQ